MIGAIAQATERLVLGTGVTCPTIRMHPAIIAQAAATSAALMPGRFFLGVGTGENLNEHILGDHWPAPDERLELLEEAIAPALPSSASRPNRSSSTATGPQAGKARATAS